MGAEQIKRLYFCPFSSPEIGKIFNDSRLSSTRQTKLRYLCSLP